MTVVHAYVVKINPKPITSIVVIVYLDITTFKGHVRLRVQVVWYLLEAYFKQPLFGNQGVGKVLLEGFDAGAQIGQRLHRLVQSRCHRHALVNDIIHHPQHVGQGVGAGLRLLPVLRALLASPDYLYRQPVLLAPLRSLRHLMYLE